MRKTILYIVLQLTTFFFVFASAQHSSSKEDIQFKSLNVSEKLTFSFSKCIYKDSKGFIWFGTRSGLFRYDAYELEAWRHKPSDPSSLVNNQISCIGEDGLGNILVGTHQGLDKYVQSTNSLTHLADPFGDRFNYAVNCVIKLPNDTLLAGTFKGLFLVDSRGNRLEEISFRGGMRNSHSVLSLVQHPDGDELWMGTFDNGIVVYYPTTGLAHKVELGYDLHDIVRLLFVSKNTLLIAANEGLFKYDLSTKQTYLLFEAKCHDIEKDIQGYLWASIGHGLYRLTPGLEVEKVFGEQESGSKELLPGITNDIFIDRSGMVWLCGSVYGVKILVGHGREGLEKTFVPAGDKLGHRGYARGFYLDDEGNLWLATFGNGLLAYDKNLNLASKINTHNSGLKSDFVTSFYPGGKDTLWVGTLEGVQGIRLATRKVFANLTTNNGLWHNIITDLAVDGNNNIWIATQEGLNRYDPRTDSMLRYSETDGLVHYKVNRLYVDFLQNIWVGTRKGVCFYSTKEQKFVNISKAEGGKYGLDNLEVFCFAQDHKKNMWIGTESGLFRHHFKDKSMKLYHEEDGLSENVIRGIQFDNNRRMWLLHPGATSVLMSDTIQKRGFRIFSGLEVNIHSMMDKEGRLFMGGVNSGFFVIQTDSIHVENHVPPVHILGVNTYDTTIIPPDNSKVVLPYSRNSLRISFAVLDYNSPKDNRFAYKMKGLDDQWHYSGGHNREVTYSNLAPGSYVFHVKGANNHNVWNNEGDKLYIEIMPPWWRTKLFYTIFVLMLTGLMLLINNIRKNRINLNNKLKMAGEQARIQHEAYELKLKYFTDISHEFRTPLTLISMPIESVLTNNKLTGRDSKNLQLAKKNINRLKSLIEQLLDYRKITKEKMEVRQSPVEVIGYIRTIVDLFEPYVQNKQISLVFNSNIKSHVCQFDVGILDKIVYNLVSNAIKNTEEHGTVNVDVKLVEDVGSQGQENNEMTTFEITISNTGRGIAPEHVPNVFNRFYQVPGADMQGGSGIGLALVKEYVGLLGGSIELESIPGKVTTFYLSFPTTGVDADKLEESTLKGMEPNRDYVEDSLDYMDETDDAVVLEKKSGHKEKTLLIVEDNHELRRIIIDFLAEEFHILEAENGREGLDKALEHIPDLIISDIMMSEMDGIQLCKKCKTDERTSHVPIILLTAKSLVEHKLEGLETGADSYITKPFDKRVLRAQIHNLIQTREKLKQYFSSVSYSNLKSVPNVNSVDKKFLFDVERIIEQNYANEEFTVEKLAEIMQISRRHLFRKFSSFIGVSPVDYIRTYRLNKAAELLKKSINPSISEIAYNSGFKHPSHFSRVFLKHFKMLPSDYMNK